MLGGAALWPLPLAAQPQATARVGLLGVPPASDPSLTPFWSAFSETLRQGGWIEGRNISFDRRWSQGRPESYSELAAELVATRPAAIVALSSQAILSARKETDKIPIIAVGFSDLVALGLAQRLARPGGNVTGFGVEDEGIFSGKLLQILQEVRPALARVALLYTPVNAASKASAEKTVAFAPRLGVVVESVAVNTPEDFAVAFAAIARSRSDGLIIHASPVLFGHQREIAAFALDHRLPSISAMVTAAREGLLLASAPDLADMWRRTAGVLDKILRGAKPADIPVELPTKFDFVVNLKTARAIAVTIPPSVLARASEVIE